MWHTVTPEEAPGNGLGTPGPQHDLINGYTGVSGGLYSSLFAVLGEVSRGPSYVPAYMFYVTHRHV